MNENQTQSIADMENATVVSLVVAAQGGDRAAFGELYQRYHQAITATAFRHVHNVAESQEVCQEVFMRAMEKIGQLRSAECFGSWLKCIARRMAINRITRRGPVTLVDPVDMAGNCSDGMSPDETAMMRERHLVVHDMLTRLKESDRKTLDAFYLKGESIREMSQTSGAPLGTIKRRLHVARKRLEKEMEIQEIREHMAV